MKLKNTKLKIFIGFIVSCFIISNFSIFAGAMEKKDNINNINEKKFEDQSEINKNYFKTVEIYDLAYFIAEVFDNAFFSKFGRKTGQYIALRDFEYDNVKLLIKNGFIGRFLDNFFEVLKTLKDADKYDVDLDKYDVDLKKIIRKALDKKYVIKINIASNEDEKKDNIKKIICYDMLDFEVVDEVEKNLKSALSEEISDEKSKEAEEFLLDSSKEKNFFETKGLNTKLEKRDGKKVRVTCECLCTSLENFSECLKKKANELEGEFDPELKDCIAIQKKIYTLNWLSRLFITLTSVVIRKYSYLPININKYHYLYFYVENGALNLTSIYNK